MTRNAIVIEKAAGNYSVYVPDLPGCVATAATIEAAEEEIREAIHAVIAKEPNPEEIHQVAARLASVRWPLAAHSN